MLITWTISVQTVFSVTSLDLWLSRVGKFFFCYIMSIHHSGMLTRLADSSRLSNHSCVHWDQELRAQTGSKACTSTGKALTSSHTNSWEGEFSSQFFNILSTRCFQAAVNVREDITAKCSFWRRLKTSCEHIQVQASFLVQTPSHSVATVAEEMIRKQSVLQVPDSH